MDKLGGEIAPADDPETGDHHKKRRRRRILNNVFDFTAILFSKWINQRRSANASGIPFSSLSHIWFDLHLDQAGATRLLLR